MSDATTPAHRVVVVALTAAAAATDALGYLGLGHVFPANMTGNTVLLGIGLATADHAAAARSAVALGANLLAAFTVGAATAGRGSPTALRRALLIEFAVLAALAAWWISPPAAASGAWHSTAALIPVAALGVVMPWRILNDNQQGQHKPVR